MAKTPNVRLTPEERVLLQDLTQSGQADERALTRARILLQGHEGTSVAQTAAALGVGTATVRRVRKRYLDEGLANALGKPLGRHGPPPGDDEPTSLLAGPPDHAAPTPSGTSPTEARQGPDTASLRDAPHRGGTHFTGTVAGNSEGLWFTSSWPAAWHVIWTVMPTTVQPGAPQLSWSVAVELSSSGYATYWIKVRNLTPTPVSFEGRYAVIHASG
jgi:Homeodomain-like domain